MVMSPWCVVDDLGLPLRVQQHFGAEAGAGVQHGVKKEATAMDGWMDMDVGGSGLDWTGYDQRRACGDADLTTTAYLTHVHTERAADTRGPLLRFFSLPGSIAQHTRSWLLMSVRRPFQYAFATGTAFTLRIGRSEHTLRTYARSNDDGLSAVAQRARPADPSPGDALSPRDDDDGGRMGAVNPRREEEGPIPATDGHRRKLTKAAAVPPRAHDPVKSLRVGDPPTRDISNRGREKLPLTRTPNVWRRRRHARRLARA
nr:unnamed protein product [Digitaria exilis]